MSRPIEKHDVLCRRCKMKLKGSIGRCYHPTKLDAFGSPRKCPENHYGGHVCSMECDYYAALDLEKTMPGHAGQKSLSRQERARLELKWISIEQGRY